MAVVDYHSKQTWDTLGVPENLKNALSSDDGLGFKRPSVI